MLSVKGIYENGQVRLLEPVPFMESVKVIVTLLDEEANNRTSKKPRPIGGAKGSFEIPSSFFEDLPDELLNAFKGKGG